MGNLLGKTHVPALKAAALPGQTQPEARPLLTPEELLAWRPSPADDACRAAVPLPEVYDGGPAAPRPRLLACHDMRGGYLEDRWAQGGADADAYTFRHWAAIDAFVYFSHSLVTVPPPGWVNAGHRHGVPVLGTLITEWEQGAQYCVDMFGCTAAAEATAAALAEIASHFGFDGWLINIENAMDMELVPNLLHFLRTLRGHMRAVCPRGAGVIWYDAVTVEGRLDWQNILNRLNRPFLDAADAIWINYTWKEGTPAEVQAEAGPRARDVYMGIDCYGRGTYGGGGYCCDIALHAARAAGLSVALFAPGWPFDARDDPSAAAEAAEEQAGSGGAGWRDRDERFWACISAAWGPPRAVLTGLPAATNFCVGTGRRVMQQGLEVSPCSWYNLSLQGLQPSLGTTLSEASGLSMRCTDAAAFDGGGSLVISGQLSAPARINLFRGAAPLPEGSGLAVSLTSAAGPSVCLVLAVQLRCNAGPRRTLLCRPVGPAGGKNSPLPLLTVAELPVREERTPFALLPSQGEDVGAAGPAEWVTLEHSFPPADCGGAGEAEICSVDVLVQPMELAAPCRCEAYLGFLSLAAETGDEPRSPPQSVSCLVAEDIQLRSGPAAAAGVGSARELAVRLRWAPPAARAGGGCERYCIWYSFEGGAGERALQYLGTACLPLYQVSYLAVPVWAGAVRFAVQVVSGLGLAQLPGGAAQLRLLIPTFDEDG